MRRERDPHEGRATAPGARRAPARWWAASALAATALVGLTACGQPAAPTSDGPASSTPASSTPTSADMSAGDPGASASTAATSAAGVPEAPDRPVTKLLVLVVENHSRDQMRTEMPYTSMLADGYGYATDFHGVTYPSLPNYLAMTSGSTHGVADDRSPPKHQLAGPSVFGQALAHGRTAGLYADGMPSNCDPDSGGDHYQVKHNPWAYYASERTMCQDHDVPATELSDAVRQGRLPNAGMIVPNMCHDAHDCPLSVADQWIRSTLGTVFDGPDWRSGHLAVVVTADTDDRNADNRVLTVVVHPSQHHHVVDQRLDHYSLSRLYSSVVHAAPLGHAASAASMSDAFGLPVG